MKLCYLNITPSIPPRDAVYLRGMRESGIEIVEIMDNTKGLKKFWRIYKKYKALPGTHDLVWVGYTAHILVPFVWLISSKKIIFNALTSMYEGMIISRAQARKISVRAACYWVLDFIVFHLADLSLVESTAQKEHIKKFFFVSDKRLLKSWTGVDDRMFYFDPRIKKAPDFTVLFRGGFLPESGIEYAIEAAQILKNEDIKFRIIGDGLMANSVAGLIKKYNLNNVEWLRGKMDSSELRMKMLECHLCLGQLSNHDRLKRTIPHKVFESLAMKIPYLTSRTPAILELVKEDDTCFCFAPADVPALAEKIIALKQNPSIMERVAQNGYQLFERELQPKHLVKDIIQHISH